MCIKDILNKQKIELKMEAISQKSISWGLNKLKVLEGNGASFGDL